MKHGLIVFFLTVLLLEKELRATITQGPSNAVAEDGGQVKLNCVATNPIGYWSLSKNGVVADEVTLAGPGCSIRPAYVDHYEVESLGGGTTCNLIVFNITMAQAGVYRCLESPSEFLSILTVIDESITMASNTTLNIHVAVENETVVNTCTLNYNGSVSPASTLQPHFYWTDSNGQNTPSYNDSTTDNTVVSQLTVKAGRKNITSYRCNVRMQLNASTNPNYANNIPAVSKNASSPAIEVLYSPGNTSITSTIPISDKCVSKPENLTCTADANPPAYYSWKDPSNSARSNDSIISITSGGEYQCFARNEINGKTYTDTKVANEDTCHEPYNLTISGPSCENNFCVCYDNQTLVMMTCSASGTPKPSVHWRSGNDDLGVDETIETNLNGNYSCTTSNTFGNEQHNETVIAEVSSCQDDYPSSSTTSSTGGKAVQQSVPMGAIVGAIIGVFVIANVVALCLFFWYYKKFEVSHSGKKERNNKLRLDRRFPWLKKMMPCVSETKESAGSNCLWVSLFILLGIVTGIVTFPVWIMLAKKYEKNNETSALNRRQNGEGNGSGENGRPTNISSANHNQPPSTNQMNAIRREDPYQNESSKENIELNNSLRSRTQLVSDSPPSRPPPAGRPPPPPNKPILNSSTNRSKDYTVNDQQTQAANPEHTTYADLPFVHRDTLPTANPVQFLNVSNDTYASLNKT